MGSSFPYCIDIARHPAVHPAVLSSFAPGACAGSHEKILSRSVL
jgi:hypothetical protein